MNITLTKVPYGFLVTAADGRDAFFQDNNDLPGLASTFGWSPRPVNYRSAQGWDVCYHRRTDGTVGCPECGTRPREFLYEAIDWLYENIGATANDPGYLS